MFSLPVTRLVFMVPLPCLRLTRATPVPSAPSVTRAESSHVDKLQFSEQLDCRLRSWHAGLVKSVTYERKVILISQQLSEELDLVHAQLFASIT